jgi:hypothetical protein
MEVVQELAQKTLQFWNTVPQGAQWALAGVGALYVVRNVLSFVQLILSCFILSGTNVRPRCPVVWFFY